MSELLLVSSLESVEVGSNLTKSRHPWLTLQQYFTIPEDRFDDFTQRVSGVVEGFDPVIIQGTELAEYGPNNDVPVRRVIALGKGATLAALHTVLGEAIYHHGGDMRNPEWAFEGYNPHVTFVDGRALDEGETATLRTVELVGKDAQGDKVVRNMWRLEP